MYYFNNLKQEKINYNVFDLKNHSQYSNFELSKMIFDVK